MSKTLNDAIRLNADTSGLGGLMTNPFFEISQEYPLTNITTNGYYPVDQWQHIHNGSGTLAVIQVSEPYSAITGYKKLRNSLKTTVGTAYSSYTATQFISTPIQFIEGNFIANLGFGTGDASSIDVVMVVTASITGTYALAIRNGVPDRSYVTTFTLVANTPTIIFKTIPGDTSGTWSKINTSGMWIHFGGVSGTTYQAPTLNAWQAGNYFSHSSATNWGATSGATVEIGYFNIFPTGVLPFISATDSGLFDCIIGTRRPYDIELRRCQRYWALVGLNIRGPGGGAGTVYANSFYTPVAMRVTPSTNYVSGSTNANINLGVFSYTPTSGMVQNITLAAGDSYAYNYVYSVNARM